MTGAATPGLTREELIEVAAAAHDEAGCSCDRRYLMSCPKMTSAILQASRVKIPRARNPAASPIETADEKTDALELRDQWVVRITEAGLRRTHGAGVRWMPGAHCWGVFIEPYADGPAVDTRALGKLLALAARASRSH